LLDDLLEIAGCSLGEALRSIEACAESLSFLLSLGGELFPCRTFLGFLAGALLGGLPGAGVFLSRQSGLLRGCLGREKSALNRSSSARTGAAASSGADGG
jgi:hypothetical protein